MLHLSQQSVLKTEFVTKQKYGEVLHKYLDKGSEIVNVFLLFFTKKIKLGGIKLWQFFTLI